MFGQHIFTTSRALCNLRTSSLLFDESKIAAKRERHFNCKLPALIPVYHSDTTHNRTFKKAPVKLSFYLAPRAAVHVNHWAARPLKKLTRTILVHIWRNACRHVFFRPLAALHSLFESEINDKQKNHLVLFFSFFFGSLWSTFVLHSSFCVCFFLTYTGCHIRRIGL